MEKATLKNLANINGSVIKKAISMNKTLLAGDDKATVELVRQLGTAVVKMTGVINKYGNGTSLPMPMTEVLKPTEIPLDVIQDKIEKSIPKEYDVLKIARNNGKVTVYFEPTMKQIADNADAEVCADVVRNADMKPTNMRLIDGGMSIAIDLDSDSYGNPILSNAECNCADYKQNTFSNANRLAIMTQYVNRAIDSVNRHTNDQKPSIRKIKAAVGFKRDVKYMMKHICFVGTPEYARTKYLYGAIKNLEGMLESGEYYSLIEIDNSI